jgi:hypothetical protein
MTKLFTETDLSLIVQRPPTDLCKFMQKHKSDKGTQHHNYTLFYEFLFNAKKNEPLNILEIGIGSMNPGIVSNMTGVQGYKSGGSIRAWSEYFPNSVLYCCDVDKDIINFPEENIHGFFLDQTDTKGVYTTFYTTKLLKNVTFDIIIDDGYHHFPTNVNVMHTLMPKLKKGGWYIIEDILDYNPNLMSKGLPYEWQYVQLPNPYNTVDNNLLVCKK